MATLRATSDLQNNIFIDNTAGQISAQDMRDFVESVPNEKSTGKFEDDVKVKFGTTGGSFVRWSSTATDLQLSSTEGGGSIDLSPGIGTESLDLSIAPTWTGSHTFNADMTLGMASQDYVLNGAVNRLRIRAQSSGSPAFVDLEPQDRDGTDDVAFRLNGVGNLNTDDNEIGYFLYNAGAGRMELRSLASGTGTVRPLHVFTGPNTNQFVARTDGNVAMANSLKVGGTGAADETFEAEGDISIQANSTTSGTNLVVSTNDGSQQKVQRSSSTARVKSEIQPLTAEAISPDRVLEIDPVSYLRDGEPEVGFVAESFDWGPLSHGLAYDGEDRVFGFLSGSRVIDAAQQVVLQDHETRISSTEAKIEQLERENEQLRQQLEEAA